MNREIMSVMSYCRGGGNGRRVAGVDVVGTFDPFDTSTPTSK